MPVDIAVDYRTGDLVVSPDKSFDIRTGQATVDQRIRTRLRIVQGSWILDPTGGSLGSRLRESFRLPRWRALTEIPLIVREALQPMRDIQIRDVACEEDPLKATAVTITVYYSLLENDATTSDDVLSTSLNVTE